MCDRLDTSVTKTSLLEKLEEIIDCLLDWPFKCPPDKPLFTEKQMTLLRSTSDRIEKLRKQRNIAVISGSSAGVVGGALSVAGGIITLIPGIGTAIGLGLLIPGVVIGTAGSGVGTGFSLRKFLSDYKKKKKVTPCLKKFVECLHQAVTAFIKIDIAFTCIEEMKLVEDESSCRQNQLLQQSEKRLQKILRERDNESIDVLFKIQCVKQHVEFVIEMLKKNKIAIIGTKPYDVGPNEEKLAQADEKPFEMLKDSLCNLAERMGEKKTFNNFIYSIFEENKNFDLSNEQSPLGGFPVAEGDMQKRATAATGGLSKTATVSAMAGSNGVGQITSKLTQCSKVACEAGKGFGHISKAGLKSTSSTASVTKFGGTVQKAGKLTATAGSTTSNAAKTTKGFASASVNIGRVTKGIAAAGIAMGVLGIVIDAVFIGHAIYDMRDNEKEEFSKLLDNTLIIMTKINRFLTTP